MEGGDPLFVPPSESATEKQQFFHCQNFDIPPTDPSQSQLLSLLLQCYCPLLQQVIVSVRPPHPLAILDSSNLIFLKCNDGRQHSKHSSCACSTERTASTASSWSSWCVLPASSSVCHTTRQRYPLWPPSTDKLWKPRHCWHQTDQLGFYELWRPRSRLLRACTSTVSQQ